MGRTCVPVAPVPSRYGLSRRGRHTGHEAGEVAEVQREHVVGLLAVGVAATVGREAAAVARLRRHRDPRERDHTARVGAGSARPLRVLLLGDSAVDGHGLRVEDALPRRLAQALAAERPVDVESLAVSGATSADVLAFQVPLVTDGVDLVVVGVGVNDALRLVRLDAVADATRRIVAGVRAAAPDATLVVVPCHDLGTAPGPGPLLSRVLSQRCRRVARTQLRELEEVGVPAAAAGGADELDGMYGLDGLHPGADGVRAIAAAVVDALPATAPAGAPDGRPVRR